MKAFYIYTEGIQHTVVANSKKEAEEYFEDISEKKIIHAESVPGPDFVKTSIFDTSIFDK